MKIMTVDGNEACSNIAYMFTELSGIYPITPSSTMAEHIDEWSTKGRLNIFNDKVKIVEMQSEAGAIGLVHGALSTGVLSTTFTASQGLLLMIPNMYKIAGEMLPGVIHVAARSLSTHALSIFGDHQDIYACRMTGFNMLASSSVEDASNVAAISHLSAIKSSLPFMHFFDGFRTSHEINKINALEKEDLINLVDKEALTNFRNRALNPLNPFTKGTAQNDDIYFQMMEAKNSYYDKVPDIVNECMKEINKITNHNYAPFNYYGSENAENIIIAMGSVCETIKETVDNLNKNNYNVGLVEVHLYRPFSSKYLLNVLPKTVKNIAVLDRTKEQGCSGEPLYLDVVNILKDKNINIIGGRYGLSSKNTTPRQIKAVYDNLMNEKKSNFTIGIIDDVTNLSLKVDNNFTIKTSDEFLIYGYGSDGMVSASKSIIKLVGDNTNKYVQGYFEYDSKKSGGVTKGHLRFSDDKIRSTYYVENPSLVVITKDNYLEDFDCLSNISENGTLIINTTRTKEELIDLIQNKKELIAKNIKIYMINAYELARKVGLKNKISTIMECVIIYLSNIINYDEAKEKIKEFVIDKFSKKGEEIVKSNIDAIEESIKYLELLSIKDDGKEKVNRVPNTIYEMISKRMGNELPTSSFINTDDGIVMGGTSALEKRGISDIVPSWINGNCINCNMCSFVCPHSVIRPFLLNEDEYNNAPEYVKERCIKTNDLYYLVAISVKDCTGCGLCIKTCPGKKNEKALISKKRIDEIKNHEQEVFDYVNKNITYKNVNNVNTVKGSQFVKPKFEFCGACAGCGETSYIKLLTQLFGKSLVISNATGCSSIYGASMPNMPYTVPWASSLFEDNAEYGYGMLMADKVIKNRLKNIMLNNMDNKNSELFKLWLNNIDNYEITKKVYDELDYSNVPTEINDLKDYLVKKSIWSIGGDGWAYDIGFSGIDHVIASNQNVNILILDTEVYSNTGGQSSKSSRFGSLASFTTSGKENSKKDLARMMMSYPNAYVATVSLGANMMQLIKAFNEAENYNGPSIIIAYAPCISHGIKGGMENTVEMQKQATKCGYFPLFRYNPVESKFHMDSKEADFELYDEFLNNQTRYSMLKKVNPDKAEELLKLNKEEAIRRFNYYKSLEETSN